MLGGVPIFVELLRIPYYRSRRFSGGVLVDVDPSRGRALGGLYFDKHGDLVGGCAISAARVALVRRERDARPDAVRVARHFPVRRGARTICSTQRIMSPRAVPGADRGQLLRRAQRRPRRAMSGRAMAPSLEPVSCSHRSTSMRVRSKHHQNPQYTVVTPFRSSAKAMVTPSEICFIRI
jgi:hypothetical protein